MASVIDSTKSAIEWDKPRTRSTFPWEEWTDGKVYKAVEGTDFHSVHGTFVSQLRKRAERLKVSVKTKVDKTGKKRAVYFQFETPSIVKSDEKDE